MGKKNKKKKIECTAEPTLLCHSFGGNFSFPSVCSSSKSKPISLIILRTTFIFILLASALS